MAKPKCRDLLRSFPDRGLPAEKSRVHRAVGREFPDLPHNFVLREPAKTTGNFWRNARSCLEELSVANRLVLLHYGGLCHEARRSPTFDPKS